MKATNLLLVAICFSMITFSLFSNAAFALEQDEASASAYWTGQPFYQGSNGTLSITFISNSSDQLTIYYVGVHFDWMASDTFVGLNLQNSPVNVTSHGSYTFNPMIILIPSNVSVGSHSYFIGIDGVQGVYEGFSWDSQTFSLQIQASQQPTATPTQPATTGGGDQINLLLLIVGAAIIVVVVVLLLIMILKRKRKPSQPPTVTPSQPATTEVSQPSLSRDTVARLEKLKELRDKNLITKEEYEKKKDEILSEV